METPALTALIAVSHPTPSPQSVSSEESLMFQQLLGELITDEGLQDDSQVSETANQVEETSEESKEETTEMADALAQAMQYFIRLPMQQPPVTELKTADFASVEQDALILTVVAPLTEQSEDNSEMIEPTSTEITKDTPAPPIIHEQQPMDTTEEVSEIEDGKVTFELLSKPESDMLKQEETKVEFLENVSMDGAKDMNQILPTKAIEKKISGENEQPEKQSIGVIQPPTRTLTQAMSTPVEITKTTLTWQEPAQVIRELGETIKVTLEQSSTPTTKVVQISLTPETFGKMEIELTWQEDKVVARIVVQKDAIKQQLTDQLDLIRAFLPKNPIIQTIAIDVRPPNMLFQPHQGFQSRKQSQHAPKQHLADDKEQEEIEGASVLEGRGLSLYI
ncbi:flagellar hook-length control protein FliK [Jeotgalibaca porci]|uniref:flagellar hook-length control protein FliK n=1 Tax=Jeotgalibaca porci TaxID=1868793 RepID=UPI0035A05D4B